MIRLLPFVFSAALLGCTTDVPERPTEAELPPSYEPRGADAAGFQLTQYGDLQLKTWYPAIGDGSATLDYDVALKFPGFPEDPVAIHGTAIADAPVAEGGPYPLVVLSHGFGLNPEWYHDLAEHLATHGFVVVAPEHLEADWFADVIDATASRPSEVSAAIDFADAHEGGWVDTDRVAVLGHSYGGYTALASAGARIDPSSLAERCEAATDRMMQAYFCDSFVGQEQALASALGLDSVPDGLWPAAGDPRVDSVVSIAGDAYLFGEDGLAAVQVPVMAIGGTADTGTPWTWGSQLTYDAVGSDDRALVGLEGAEHMVVTASCDDMPFTQAMPPEYAGYFCEDPAWDKAGAHDVIHHLTTAWLKHTLQGDAEAEASLAPELYDDVDGLLMMVE